MDASDEDSDGSTAVALLSCTVASNAASGSGGALSMDVGLSVTANDTTFLNNQAAFGGGVALVRGAGSPADVPAWLGTADGAAAAGVTLSGNNATSWGALAASDGFALAVVAPATTAAGDPFNVQLALSDSLQQLVPVYPQSAVAVSAAQGVIPVGVPTAAYAASTPLAGLRVRGDINQSYLLSFQVSAPSLQPVAAAVNVTVAAGCRPFEARAPAPPPPSLPPPLTSSVARRTQEYNEAALQCVCVPNSEQSPDGTGCKCVDGFHSFSPVGMPSTCRPCPSYAVCRGGLMAPMDGWWHSSPESEDLQSCPQVAACSSSGGATSRVDALFALQTAAVANASGGVTGLDAAQRTPTLTDLILSGALNLNAYVQLQCAAGCATAPGALCVWRSLRVDKARSAPRRAGTRGRCASHARRATATCD